MSIEDIIDWNVFNICGKIAEKYLKLGYYIKHTEADKISVKEIEDFFKLNDKLIKGGVCDIYRRKGEGTSYR